jgi:guanylate kinase
MKKGQIILFTGPSCAGKNTVVEALLKALPNAKRLITTTTRQPRPGEQNGIDYHFVTPEVFEHQRRRGDFLEYAENYGNWYATSMRTIEEMRTQHDYVFMILDVQNGAPAIRRAYPDARIFGITTEDFGIIEERLVTARNWTPRELVRRAVEAYKEFNILLSEGHAYGVDIVFQNAQGDGKLERLVETIRLMILGNHPIQNIMSTFSGSPQESSLF